MEQLFETAVGLAEQGRTMLGGIPMFLDLALFTEEFEDEVRGAFPPRWLQRIVLRTAGLAREAPPAPAPGIAAAGRPSMNRRSQAMTVRIDPGNFPSTIDQPPEDP